MKNYIEELLSSIGVSGPSYGGLFYEGLSSISPKSIASGLASTYGIDKSLLSSSFLTGITPGMLQGTYGKTYSPLIQAKQTPLLQGLTSGIEGVKGRQAMGGFARSGQARDYQAGVKDVYGKGMIDVLSEVSSSIGGSEQNIIDLINSWKQTAQGIRYGNV